MASRDGKQLRALTNEVRMIKFKEEITANYKNKAHLNPKVMQALNLTTPGTISHVILAELDDSGAEFALRAAQPDEPGALELKFSESGRTAQFLVTLLVTRSPAMATPRQRIRHFPVAVPEGEAPGYLILKAKESYLTVAPKRKKKSDESTSEEAVEPAAEAKASAEVKQAADEVAATTEE